MTRLLAFVFLAVWPVLSWAAPAIVVDGALGSGLESIARDAWDDCARRFTRDTGVVPASKLESLRIRTDVSLPPGHAGGASPGVIGVRQARAGVVDERLALALRHEVAHQFLWSACPAGARDRLFHEAYAVASSGEIPVWTRGEYLSLPKAVRTLHRARSLDVPSARRALARVLLETAGARELAPSLERRLQRCADGAAWGAPMTVDELASGGASFAHALVVLSRHSGEVLVSSGAVHQPMPYGSTLKPFVLAGALARGAKPPALKPRAGVAEWACGDDLGDRVASDTALLRSCNGWFLDWAKRDAKVAKLGPFGAALVKLGLAREPRDMPEAIGLRSTLSLSPLALAAAYRLLAESRPDVVSILKRNADEGTLSQLEVSPSLRGWALKTGTVRDERSAATVGWIVAVNADFVVVMAQPGRAPRTFASEVVRALNSIPQAAAHAVARVQVFGLLEPSQVELRCQGRGFAVDRDSVVALGNGWLSMPRQLRKGALVCSDGPWSVRFPGEPGRAYAGVFHRDVAPAYRPAPGERVGGRTLRARRGSDVVFTTTLARYVAGVLTSEDATLSDGAKEAVARVVAHNVRHSRHEGRPVCDTTHCQAFKGTFAPGKAVRSWVTKPVPGANRWLLFSQGGDEPWSQTRPRGVVEGLLGRGVTAISFADGRVRWLRQAGDASMPYDEAKSAPCEFLRGALKLPSCPEKSVLTRDTATFSGRGRGHGEGIDVEAAKAGGLDADEILRRAYGGR